MISIIDQIEVDYARFNARKTFSTTRPSLFEQKQFGSITATRDRARPDSYYNRVLGLTEENTELLDDALEWISSAAESGHRLRIDVKIASKVQSHLAHRGCELVDQLMWLHADPKFTAIGDDPSSPTAARPLTSDDWPELRQLLHGHGKIPDDIWHDKRTHLCTDTFRWVGIFDHHQLVSAASTWVTTNAVVFGSAYTRPQWRGRGYQQRLLDARLRSGEAAAYVDVTPDSTSYRNCVSAGFRDLEHRQVWECQPLLATGISRSVSVHGQEDAMMIIDSLSPGDT